MKKVSDAFFYYLISNIHLHDIDVDLSLKILHLPGDRSRRLPLSVHHHTKLFVAQLVVLQQDIFFFLSWNRTFVCFCLFFPAIGHFLPGIFCPATGNIFLFWICLTSSRKTLCSLLSYNRKYRSSKDSLENSLLQQKRSNLPCFGQIL